MAHSGTPPSPSSSSPLLWRHTSSEDSDSSSSDDNTTTTRPPVLVLPPPPPYNDGDDGTELSQLVPTAIRSRRPILSNQIQDITFLLSLDRHSNIITVADLAGRRRREAEEKFATLQRQLEVIAALERENYKLIERSKCVICREKPNDVVALPCMHKIYCDDCIKPRQHLPCAVCKEIILDQFYIFN